MKSNHNTVSDKMTENSPGSAVKVQENYSRRNSQLEAGMKVATNEQSLTDEAMAKNSSSRHDVIRTYGSFDLTQQMKSGDHCLNQDQRGAFPINKAVKGMEGCIIDELSVSPRGFVDGTNQPGCLNNSPRVLDSSRQKFVID